MNQELIKKFKILFEQQRLNFAFAGKVINQDFAVQSEDLADETDLTSTELETSMRMRLSNREALFAKKIEQALSRIEHGTFGACEDCEGEIELKRLEARPTATLCLSCKEESERQERLHIDGRRYKSLGMKLSFA
jgi:DnaK suppressor protein